MSNKGRTDRQLVTASVTLLVALLLSGCSASKDKGAAASSNTATAVESAAEIDPSAATPWTTALDEISADGTFSKDAALTLFALAFGDMPGVPTPSGPRNDIRSGTLAMRSVLAHESELDDSQRARVAEVRSLPDDSAGAPIVAAAVNVGLAGFARLVKPAVRARALGAALAVAAPSADPGVRHLLDATAKQVRQDIAARMGDIPGPIKLVFDARDDSEGNVGWADPQYQGGRYASCTMHIMPAAFKVGRVAATTLAHEMVHCFQAAAYGTKEAFYTAPGWLIEGSAEWAGATLASPDKLEVQLWHRYLAFPQTDLRRRTYDAIGFYAHMDETGHSPWAAFRKMWVAGRSSEVAFAEAGATDASFLDSWGAGTTRQASLGLSWDTNGPGITSAAPTRRPLGIGKQVSNVSAAPYTHSLYQLDVGTDLVRVSISGHGRLSDGNVDTEIAHASLYCTKEGGCTCPEGDGPDVPPVPLHKAGASLALTGGPAGTKGTLQGLDLADICPTKPTKGPVDVCSLVSDAEVAQVLGVPTARVEPHAEGAGRSCIKGAVRAADNTDFFYVSVAVFRTGADAFGEATKSGARPVRGVGARATFLASAGALLVATGDDLMLVQVVKGGVPQPEAVAVGVARRALARLR